MQQLSEIQQRVLGQPSAAAFCACGDDAFNDERPFDALLCFQHALALAADSNAKSAALAKCGAALHALECHNQAAACYRDALRLDPDNDEAHANLGVLTRPSDVALSIASFRRAVALDPDCADYQYGLACSLLAQGDFAEGWQRYDVRRALPWCKPRHTDLPMWDGSSGRGNQTLLIYDEQGFGDTIQFVRFLALVRERFCGTLFFETRRELVRLFYEQQWPRMVIVTRGIAEVQADYAFPLMSLPLLFGLNDEKSFLPNFRLTRSSRHRHPKRRPRVGLCWAGEPRFDADRRRSISLRILAPLADKNIEFISLQKDGEIEQPFGEMEFFAPVDFADTAYAIGDLDLVVAVDTAVAHLSAAMGKPTWLLSRYDNSWRWLGDREDSPWYPTLRQFRQPKWGDWASVIERVCSAL